MSKVTVKAGFTLHVGHPSVNEYGRVDVEIVGIDTELPLDTQLKEAGAAISGAWEALLPELDKSAHDVIGVTIQRRGS